MLKPRLTKLRVIAAASLLGLAGVSAPASAHHGHGYVVPLAAFITLGALMHHGHHHRHHHHYHYRYHYHRHHRHHHHHHRRHSHSHGGYYKKHRKW